MKTLQLTGRRFGRLVAMRQGPPSKSGKLRWKCKCDCGTEAIVPTQTLVDGRTKSCGCYKLEMLRQQRGAKSRSWRGGRSTDGAGYVLVYAPDHPRAKSNGYVREHLLVMGEILGRAVRRDEQVHHLNGVRNDNRRENLELWTQSHPPGKRVAEAVAWARDIIALYGDQYP